MFLNCIHYSEQGGFASALFYAEPSKKVIKNTQNYHRHNKWPDSFSHSSPHKQGGGHGGTSDSTQTSPQTFSSPDATLKTSSATEPTARRAAVDEWTSFQMVSLSTWNTQTRVNSIVQRTEKRDYWRIASVVGDGALVGQPLVNWGWEGSLVWVIFQLQSLSFKAAVQLPLAHGEAETHVWKTTREEKGPKLHKIKGRRPFWGW